MLMPKRLGCSGVRRGAKLAGPGVRRGVQCGVARRHSSLAAPQKTKASLKGSPEGGPVVPLWKPRTNGQPNDKRDCRVRDPCALAGPGTHFSSSLKVAVAFEGSPTPARWVLRASSRSARAPPTVPRSPDWLKMKNPACSAVKREAEEDWGR